MTTNLVYVTPQTAVTHKASGASGATITLTSLANAAGRQSTSFDLGASFSRWQGLLFQTLFGTGPTDRALVQIFIAWSADNSNFGGALSSSDAAFTDTVINGKLDLVMAFLAKNNTAAQNQYGWFEAKARYGLWVVYNASGQSLSGTAGDHVLTTIPNPDNIQAAA